MRKCLFFSAVLFCLVFSTAFAQTHNSVEIEDSVYSLLSASEGKGYCSVLYNVRPYSESYVISKLDEIIDCLEKKIDNVGDRKSVV